MVLYIFSCKSCIYNMPRIIRNFLKNGLVLYIIINHIKDKEISKIQDLSRGGECMESKSVYD